MSQNRPKTNSNHGKKPNPSSTTSQQIVARNPAQRGDAHPKADKVVERFKMTTSSEYSDTPGSTTSVSTVVTVTQTRHEKPTQASSLSKKTPHPNQPKNEHKPANKNHNPAGANHAGKGPQASTTTTLSANDMLKQPPRDSKNPKPAQQASHQSATNANATKPKSARHPRKAKPPTETTTTKEQMTFHHKFDHSNNPGLPGGPGQHHGYHQPTLTTLPAHGTLAVARSPAHPTQPVQFPNFSSFDLPKLVNIHPHASGLLPGPPSKGSVKVQVSKHVSSSAARPAA